MIFKLIDLIYILSICFITYFILDKLSHPDPYLSYLYGNKFMLASRIIKTGIVTIATISILLYYLVRIKKLSFKNLILTLTSISVSLLLAFIIMSHLYKKNKRNNKLYSLYHPYLQIAPPIPETDPYAEKSSTTIFCLGGSTTEFTRRDSKGWPELTQRLLNSTNKGNQITFVNLGKAWYTTLHTLINFVTNIRQHKPDVIIVMHGVNDLLHNADKSFLSHGNFRQDYGHFYGPMNRIIENHSLWERITNILKIWAQKPSTILEVHDFPGIHSFEQNLNALIDLAQRDSIKVVLMTQPTLIKERMTQTEKDALYLINVETFGSGTKWSYMSAWRGMELYNNKTREIAKKRGVYLIDLEKAIPKDLTYFWDGIHYYDETFQMIAEYIVNQIRLQDIIEIKP